MIQVGKYNELEVAKIAGFGIYLKKDGVEILMPNKWVPERAKIGDILNVFVFRDSEDRLIATTIEPLASADTFAFLEVKQVNSVGAFLNWGMDKDLFVPFKEQNLKMEERRSYVVFVYVDESTDRLMASAKLNKFFKNNECKLKSNDIVDLLIYSETNLGFNAVINNAYGGLIYKNEIFETLRVGDKTKGFVKSVREDGKIDLMLQKTGYELQDDAKWRILAMMKENNGMLKLTDNSSPEEIKSKLQISKKAFKRAVGALYKERLVKLTPDGMELLS